MWTCVRLPLCLATLASATGLGGIVGDYDYGSPQYWDKRYEQQKGTYEWYMASWKTLKPLFEPYVQPTSRILHIGTGNSELPEEMHQDGYRNQVATDISAVVIKTMQERLGHLAPDLVFSVEDATRMSFPDNSFDVVLEKGTLEAVSADRDCVLREDNCELLAVERTLVLEGVRLLKPGGVFIAVCDELEEFPELRKKGLAKFHMEKVKTKVSTKRVYFLHKRNDSETSDVAEL